MKSPQGDIKKKQAEERQKCLEQILKSPAKKKLIVAGPGTGKTYTFGKILKLKAEGRNLAMTFIRRLVTDMEKDLAEYAETKTFHAYCKMVLHQQNGRVDLKPFLTKIVEKDACLLDQEDLNDFEKKIKMLDEDSLELDFYLKRGDYYSVVGFDDSVYRLYKLLLTNPDIIPFYDQIVIDEFQDFNPLEVAFISELEKKGPILIVGDDDQAIYEGRCSSPEHLRKKFQSGKYALFELPFCGRCPKAIVDSVNEIIKKAISLGHLKARVPKRYECYLEDKEADSARYPNITIVQFKLGSVIPKYIHGEISKIDPADIAESHKDGKEYPTVLIVGSREYLKNIEKDLRPKYPQLSYSYSSDSEYGLVDGYVLLLQEVESNLGWRILMEYFCQPNEQKEILSQTRKSVPMNKLLDSNFVEIHLAIVEIIKKINSGEKTTQKERNLLKKILDDRYDEVVKFFESKKELEKVVVDKTKPSILLTSFQGCKGLSAGHVFIVGANNESIPKDSHNIEDVEISKFIVALTRTRKKCHIVSNKWLFTPKIDGKWLQPFEKSEFISWMPMKLIEDKGCVSAKEIK